MIQLGTLHIEFGTMLVQIIAFIILMWLVIRFAMKPAMKVLNERQSHIHNQITGAEAANQEAARLVEEQKKILNEARKDAHALLEQAKQQKDREAELIIKAAQERAERIIQQASEEIQNEKVRAIAELREEVGTLSVMLASKIIEKEMNPEYQQDMIHDFLKQVEGRI